MTNAALEAARLRRKELYDAMVAVEQTSQRPARTERWQEDLVSALQRLEAAFQAHVDATEAPDGIITTVVAETPRLSNEAQRLAGEHPVLLDEIETVMGKVKGAVLRDTTATGELREQILVLLGDLSRHRSAGSDFVWDAYAIDIGGGG